MEHTAFLQILFLWMLSWLQVYYEYLILTSNQMWCTICHDYFSRLADDNDQVSFSNVEEIDTEVQDHFSSLVKIFQNSSKKSQLFWNTMKWEKRSSWILKSVLYFRDLLINRSQRSPRHKKRSQYRMRYKLSHRQKSSNFSRFLNPDQSFSSGGSRGRAFAVAELEPHNTGIQQKSYLCWLLASEESRGKVVPAIHLRLSVRKVNTTGSLAAWTLVVDAGWCGDRISAVVGVAIRWYIREHLRILHSL